ncbi:hypothetical protein CQY20_01725 [Mycolicibacterium agri]|uniref:Secreted protein n=1 Tax=Mycolicibacterium agri TaxID=36811 RepID=A0A2A7NFZ8_MYCAG|nr:hypothetical protein [Mycolicibacterium agri]PEG42736.1 hypothetical protein CQY20_01725 [Mycolicibacterium agri]GFG52724.1 hypothetical protein MAGR_41650 [Mycolicibacterium agri]
MKINNNHPALLRHATAAASATVLVGGLLAQQLSAAPTASADRTVTAEEICSARNLVPKVRFFPGPVVGYCTHTLNVMPGNSIFGVDEFELRPGGPGLPASAYKVNPWEPLSDWVIPE